MKKMLALLAVLCSATVAFAQNHEDDAVVVGKQSSATSPFPIRCRWWSQPRDTPMEHGRRKGSRQSSDRRCFLRC